MTPTRSLRARALDASLWTAAGFGAQRALQLASNLVLTRLLFPKAFGLMALANVFLTGLSMFSDVGIRPAVIQNARGEDEAFLNTAWSIQIVRGFVLWLAAALLALPVAHIYGEPVLAPLLVALGATAAINGFASTAMATAERRLHLGRMTIVQLTGQAVSLILTGLLSWWLRSVWALAYGSIAGALVSVIMGHLFLSSHRHYVRLEIEALTTILRFGRWIFLGTMVTYLGGQGLRAIQGIFLSAAAIGILSIAQTFASMFSDLSLQLLGAVGFPALSEAFNRDQSSFATTLEKLRVRLLVLTLPGFFILAFFSQPLIHFLYDSRYTEAGPVSSDPRLRERHRLCAAWISKCVSSNGAHAIAFLRTFGHDGHENFWTCLRLPVGRALWHADRHRCGDAFALRYGRFLGASFWIFVASTRHLKFFVFVGGISNSI